MNTDFKQILQVDSELSKIQDLDLLLESILREARKVVRADAGSIYVVVPEENKLSFKYSQNDTIQKTLPPGQKEEFKIMQQHTLLGAGLFGDVNSSIDKLARDIALTHHENWDGTGYPGWADKVNEEGKPLGRKAEEIPLAGRIVAIADVYDALCSKRVYKDPWTEDDVLAEMRKCAGTKFEPELVDIFFEILPNIKQTQSLYPEV